MNTVRVAVLSDDRLFCEGLLRIIGDERFITVVGHGEEAALRPALRAAGPDVLLVDSRLATSDPRIYAIGDCAQHPGAVAGLLQPAWDQAAVLAALLTGADPDATYHGTPNVTRLVRLNASIRNSKYLRSATANFLLSVVSSCLTISRLGAAVMYAISILLTSDTRLHGIPLPQCPKTGNTLL